MSIYLHNLTTCTTDYVTATEGNNKYAQIQNIKNYISFAFYLTSENAGRFLQTTHYYSLSSM